MTIQRESWAIVGGGILGMTLALRLQQRGQEVVLIESAPRIGGLASAWRLGEVTWDRHYHVTLLSDSHLRKLLDELGLGDDVRWATTRTGFYTDGRLYSMSNALEFLRFPPLSLVDKLRLGATIFHASRIKDWKDLEQIPVSDWLIRWSGRRTFEKLWLPLLRAKLGDNYRHASAAFIWAIIARMYAARRTGLKREMFGYVRGGYARILDRFAQRLDEAGVAICCPRRVERICRQEDGLLVDCADGGAGLFDRVVVTTPAPAALQVCEGLSDEERERLQGIRYQGIVCASLLLKKPLAGYYVTNITDDDLPFTGVIEMTALVDPLEMGSRHLVYLPKYVTPDDPIFQLTDRQIEDRFLTALQGMYPNFQRTDVEAFRVSRVRHVLAVSTLNYSQRLPPMVTSVPGLSIVNSAHIVNGTLNVNETVQLAERAVAELCGANHPVCLASQKCPSHWELVEDPC
jgi:protoporphyrinogen oxidase